MPLSYAPKWILPIVLCVAVSLNKNLITLKDSEEAAKRRISCCWRIFMFVLCKWNSYCSLLRFHFQGRKKVHSRYAKTTRASEQRQKRVELTPSPYKCLLITRRCSFSMRSSGGSCKKICHETLDLAGGNRSLFLRREFATRCHV